jgi:hypothetical protein
MFVAPHEGWRRAEITERRTRKDWAGQIKKLAGEDFSMAEKIVLVMDNLNTLILSRPCMGPFLRERRDGCGASWKFAIPRNMEAGSTWLR